MFRREILDGAQIERQGIADNTDALSNSKFWKMISFHTDKIKIGIGIIDP